MKLILTAAVMATMFLAGAGPALTQATDSGRSVTLVPLLCSENGCLSAGPPVQFCMDVEQLERYGFDQTFPVCDRQMVDPEDPEDLLLFDTTPAIPEDLLPFVTNPDYLLPFCTNPDNPWTPMEDPPHPWCVPLWSDVP